MNDDASGTVPPQILETCLYVDDLAVAERFYENVLGLPLVGKQDERHLFFRVGHGMLLLFNPTASQEKQATTPPHGAIGAGHLAFLADLEEQAAWESRLAQHQVQIERVLNWPGGGRSLYFRDPAGNSLEFASADVWGL